MDYMFCNSERIKQVLNNPNVNPELYQAIKNLIDFLKRKRVFYAAVIGAKAYELAVNLEGYFYHREYDHRAWKIGTRELSGLVIDLIDGCLSVVPCSWQADINGVKGAIEGVIAYDRFSSSYKLAYFEIKTLEPVTCSPEFMLIPRRRHRTQNKETEAKPTVIAIQ